MNKVWFITGTSKGFGREFARAALERGDRVAATARDTAAVRDLADRFGDALLPIRVDVTDRTQVFEAVTATTERFGRIDVVVNNAGYGLYGAVEELSVQELRDQLETNLFGVLHVTQAVLPILREQGSGHIFQISSVGGILTAGGMGAYSTSKWALEALSEALAEEVAPFGIKVTLIEPGAFATNIHHAPVSVARPLAAYEPLRASLADMVGTLVQSAARPEGAAAALLLLSDMEQPPLRVLFGEAPTQQVPAAYQRRLETWAEWAHLSKAADGN
ncbi:SDR family NAD(P)-dependent oxidoreductase [Streptomyces acidiscabies]|uniref:SDR family NAD(P)-dependent oxidoreductase n=1 Tax=Streptomyces acidiscabies TaxID=42234 RepID=A0AAP6EGN1_9ACTN|nr:SDR family NAD(P)-dependent oxidoreductase [Streptomyces acidiscabies]MBP5935772.1 SDR family NAD(P)-dependent oxidoreductase [Streptomyces sp. LBUM 1476]MBZ3916328.1 SDR family NAD(P)-dependent oxidoreductase [Streptomyces acidiscabies]MDX2961999.1 SDR family NAD(P)-dependent oxidoreductase [Streptomyces acidiscabies]MDX3018004.1 SDR family NAD(P)-dependent oxidoreductase [Streptomyces acidiscabies]MDX3791223.1 SDR family NAD(P)-dependent oxidoreductase [Streptomyces acidiscabies]